MKKTLKVRTTHWHNPGHPGLCLVPCALCLKIIKEQKSTPLASLPERIQQQGQRW